jgi:hypothetical protein
VPETAKPRTKPSTIAMPNAQFNRLGLKAPLRDYVDVKGGFMKKRILLTAALALALAAGLTILGCDNTTGSSNSNNPGFPPWQDNTKGETVDAKGIVTVPDGAVIDEAYWKYVKNTKPKTIVLSGGTSGSGIIFQAGNYKIDKDCTLEIYGRVTLGASTLLDASHGELIISTSNITDVPGSLVFVRDVEVRNKFVAASSNLGTVAVKWDGLTDLNDTSIPIVPYGISIWEINDWAVDQSMLNPLKKLYVGELYIHETVDFGTVSTNLEAHTLDLNGHDVTLNEISLPVRKIISSKAGSSVSGFALVNDLSIGGGSPITLTGVLDATLANLTIDGEVVLANSASIELGDSYPITLSNVSSKIVAGAGTVPISLLNPGIFTMTGSIDVQGLANTSTGTLGNISTASTGTIKATAGMVTLSSALDGLTL